MDSALLGAIVSCPRCLDAVNRLLGLPLLSERHPNDMLGPDTRSKGGKGGGFSGGGETDGHQRRLLRRVKETFEHHPQELQCSVNGFVISTLKVVAEINEHTLNVNLDERIGFVEVFSEQGIRLLYCAVEPPPNGAVEQTAQVELSEGRLLSVGITFDSAWPNLRLFYHDPQFAGTCAEAIARLSEESTEPPVEARREETTNIFKLGWRLCRHKLRQSAFWLRPGTVTVLVAALILAALMLWMRFAPGAAAELLHRAIAAEEKTAADPELATHRIIHLEERHPTDSALISRRRIEVWQSRARRVKARRLYGERGRLIAGDWQPEDGARLIYRRGAKPAQSSAPKMQTGSQLSFDEVWLWEPAAGDFTALIKQVASAAVEDAVVEENATDYVIRYERETAAGSGLVKAMLVLRRADLRAREQTLVVRQGAEVREYRFTETSSEQRPNNTVAPAIFEPEAELLSRADDAGKIDRAERLNAGHAAPLVSTPPVTASAELEVEVLGQLNRANALSGEQISLKRTAEQPSIPQVKTVSFWRSLKNAESLAARIASERK